MSKILIIDDTADLRDLLRDYLQELGYQVLAAANGNDGLALYKEQRPQLLLVDLIMPGINGFDLIRQIRKTDRKTPIIALSGFHEELSAVQRLGVHAALAKPPELDELGQLIQLLLRRCA